ncbi:MAG: adenylosuccinate synthetase, partial [Elusimicrobia bacterium]|nr:adenylosuccinate synthetase [Elusimicrobiota bacterium]
VAINGIEQLALTKLDVLAGIHPLKVCTSYRHGGKKILHFPNSRRVLEECRPNYETLSGFGEIPNTVRRFRDLPKEAQKYIQCLEDLSRAKMGFVSLGRSRDETIRIEKKSLWA